ncbi:MAG: GNAT family N-acetyltransferase [Cyclobacteriaceae bacterium]|nr:GNAT family N-acetyltransferase [Cyclobacteriaceae bacterium]
MEIRPATEADIPAIVNLLRLSLGESLMPKSESYWRWKHIDNPFGRSPVVVAVEGDQLIGVRAFMRWEWRMGEQILKAVRAVDTATHPEYQGKGIFRKLTLQLVEQCREEGVDFIYNTPNAQSMPGYLKMGWVRAGKLPVKFYVVSWAELVRTYFSKTTRAVTFQSNFSSGDQDSWIEDLVQADLPYRHDVCTVYSSRYLNWRYRAVPVVPYLRFLFEKNNQRVVIFGRMKKTRAGNEFRVTDVFANYNKIDTVALRDFREFVSAQGAAFITSTGTADVRFGLGVTLPLGPDVTVRALNLSSLENLIHFKNWHPALGDLELF